jgi:hypothetical protein
VTGFANQNCPSGCCAGYNRHVILNYVGGYGSCKWTEDLETGGNPCCGNGCDANAKGYWTLTYDPHNVYIPGCGLPGGIAGPSGSCNQDAWILTFSCGGNDVYTYAWRTRAGHATLAPGQNIQFFRNFDPTQTACGTPVFNMLDFGAYPQGSQGVACPVGSPCGTCPLPTDKPSTLYVNLNWECLFFGGGIPNFDCNCNYDFHNPQNIVLQYNQTLNCYVGSGTTPPPCGKHVSISLCCSTGLITFTFSDCDFFSNGPGPSSVHYTLAGFDVYCQEAFFLQAVVQLSIGVWATSCCPFLNLVCQGPNLEGWLFWFNITD